MYTSEYMTDYLSCIESSTSNGKVVGWNPTSVAKINIMETIKKTIKGFNQWYNSKRILRLRTFFASFLTNGRKWEIRCQQEKDLQE